MVGYPSDSLASCLLFPGCCYHSWWIKDCQFSVHRLYATRYRRICVISQSRCNVGRSFVGAAINWSRSAINRHKLGRRHSLTVAQP